VARRRPIAPRPSARKILAALGQDYQLDTAAYRSTASIGATLFKGNRTSIDDLLKQADLAMYKAKDAGRNALRFFDPDMETAVLERAALERDLRLAVRERQFLLHYQPQVLAPDASRAPKFWCAGNIRAAAWCRRASSLPWRRKPA
jgi:predicted signal transduction protein with EAL and GGDEF domain